MKPTSYSFNASPRLYWLGLLGVILLLICFYFDLLIGKVFIWQDNLFWFYPFQNYLFSSLEAGHFPLWIANLENGVPFFSDPHNGVFYPFTWSLAFFFKNGRLPFSVYSYYLVAHIILGATCIYLFLKDHKCHPLACIIGALVFCLSASMVTHIIHLPVIRAYAWWPLQMLLVRRLVVTRERKYYFWLTLSLVVAVFAGFPAFNLYGGYLLIAYWIFCATVEQNAENPGLPDRFRKIGLECLKIGAVFAAVLALCACFILPAYESLTWAPRHDWDYREKADQSVPPYYFSNLFVPNFFGLNGAPDTFEPYTRCTFWGDDKASHTGKSAYCDYSLYAGQIWLIAMAILIANWNKIERRRETAFFLGVSAFVLWFVLGRYGGLYWIAYHTIPGLSMFREPSRLRCVFSFAAAILSAYAVDALLCKSGLRVFRPLAVLAAGFVVFLGWLIFFGSSTFEELKVPQLYEIAQNWTLYGCGAFVLIGACVWLMHILSSSAAKTAAGLALVLLVFADFFFVFGFYHRGKINPDEFVGDRFLVLPQLRQLQQENGPFRVAQFGGAFGMDVLFMIGSQCFHPELETTHGYLLWYNKDMDRFHKVKNINAQLDLQNVGLVAVQDPSTGKIEASRYTNSLPRAQFFCRIHPYDSKEQLFAELESGKLDYKNEVAIFSQDFEKLGLASSPSEPVGKADARFERISSDMYKIRYETGTPGIIFVSEAFFPGWEAVDQAGNKLNIIETFGAFKGIVVPHAGAGEITVSYRPKSLRFGLLISGFSLVILGALWFGIPFLRARQ